MTCKSRKPRVLPTSRAQAELLKAGGVHSWARHMGLIRVRINHRVMLCTLARDNSAALNLLGENAPCVMGGDHIIFRVGVRQIQSCRRLFLFEITMSPPQSGFESGFSASPGIHERTLRLATSQR